MASSIAIIDYGMGNLRSVQKAFEKVGGEACITQKVDDIQRAEKIVLPGVGAIKPAMEKLSSLNIIDTMKTAVDGGKPFLGICLGFQLLFEKSDEGGDVSGLGWLKGTVKKFVPSVENSIKIPHMGWNQIHIKQKNCVLFSGLKEKPFVYFCHSYYVDPQDETIMATSTDHGLSFTSSICVDNIFGVQFHPEKSQDIGLTILKNFVRL